MQLVKSYLVSNTEGSRKAPFNMMDIKHTEDGITHINTWSKGKTELGRLLSNFAYAPFKHPEYGTFNSLEGFWYYISTGEVCDELRMLHGYEAKKRGQQLTDCRDDIPEFKELIIQATYCKLVDNPEILDMLINSTLPLVHYCVYDGKIKQAPSSKFQLEYMEELRDAFKSQ